LSIGERERHPHVFLFLAKQRRADLGVGPAISLPSTTITTLGTEKCSAGPTVTLTLQSEASANWDVDDNRWTVPINVIVAKLASFGTFPASYQFGFGAFAAHPEVGPSWKAQAAIVILLPRRR
jgi:hypothetical protein